MSDVDLGLVFSAMYNVERGDQVKRVTLMSG